MYPGLQYALLLIHRLIGGLGIEISLLENCYIVGIVFGMIYTLCVYLLSKGHAGRRSSAMLSALLASCVAGHLSRGSVFEYDNEIVAVPTMMMVFTLWNAALKTGNTVYIVLCTLSYHYLAMTWGGYILVVNALALHSAALVFWNRYTDELYKSYSLVFLLSMLLNFTIPVIGLSPLKTMETFSAIGAFGLLQVYRVYVRMTAVRWHKSTVILKLLACIGFITCSAVLTALYAFGVFNPLMPRISLMLGLGSVEPLVVSVSEHSPLTWDDVYWNYGTIVLPSLAGLYLSFARFSNADILVIILFASTYILSARLSRVGIINAPLMGMMTSDAVCTLLHKIVSYAISCKRCKNLKERKAGTCCARSRGRLVLSGMLIFTILCGLLIPNMTFFEYAAREVLSRTGVVTRTHTKDNEIIYGDGFREMYSWIRYNTNKDDPIISWWDYGYQISAMTGRTVYIDNNTNDFAHIGLIALILVSREEVSYNLVHKMEGKYILVHFLREVGRALDDISKSFWIAACAEHDYPGRVNLSTFPRNTVTFSQDENRDITLYKLSVAGISPDVLCGHIHCANPQPSIPLIYFDEVYSTENHMLRLYKVKEKDPLGRSHRTLVSINHRH